MLRFKTPGTCLDCRLELVGKLGIERDSKLRIQDHRECCISKWNINQHGGVASRRVWWFCRYFVDCNLNQPMTNELLIKEPHQTTIYLDAYTFWWQSINQLVPSSSGLNNANLEYIFLSWSRWCLSGRRVIALFSRALISLQRREKRANGALNFCAERLACIHRKSYALDIFSTVDV